MKIFNFDLNEIEDISAVKPAGVYICTFEEIKDDEEDSKGNPRINWKLRIVSPAKHADEVLNDGVSVIEPTDTSKGTMWMIKKIYNSCGFQTIPSQWSPSRDWLGKTVKCIVTVGKYTDKKGNVKEKNNIQYETMDNSQNEGIIDATGVADDLPF